MPTEIETPSWTPMTSLHYLLELLQSLIPGSNYFGQEIPEG